MTTSSQRQVKWTSLGTGRPQPPGKRNRGLIAVVGVVVVLIAVIALATRSEPGSQSPAAAEDLLAPEIPHSREGAASAAARMAGVLGSEQMFTESDRHGILQVIAVPDQRDRMIRAFDADYTPQFNKQLGLDPQGEPPAGVTFISRTAPVGTTVRSYGGTTADVSVWCSTVFGQTGKGATVPVSTGWLTMTLSLRWTDQGWRLADVQQHDGPQPAAATQFGEVPQL